MPVRDVFETSARGLAVPPCPICQRGNHVRRLNNRMALEGWPYWACDDCIVAWIEVSDGAPRSTAADESPSQFW